MAYSKIKTSFSSGELSPSLNAREDLQKYGTGLKTCRNFYINKAGGVNRRTGTRFIAETKYADKKCDLIPFKTYDESYQIEIGDGYLRFYKDKAQIGLAATDCLDFNPKINYITNLENYVKVGNYVSLNMGSDKRLFVAAPYGTDTTGKTVAVATAGSDSMSVSYMSGLITINLANSTSSKNSADLIQAALRAADASLVNYTVTENEAYSIARSISTTLSAASYTLCNKIYICIIDAAGNATNTALFPPIETTYWINQIIYEIQTPYLEADIPELKFTRSADTLFITHSDYPTYELSRYSDIKWGFSIYDYSVPPFMISNQTAQTLAPAAVIGTGINLVSSTNFFEDGHIGSYFKIYHDIDGQSVNKTFTTTESTSSIACKGTWRFKTYGATCNLTVKIEKSIDNGGTWKTLRTYTILNKEIDDYGVEDEYCLIRITCSAFSVGNTSTLTTDPFSHAGIIKITSRTNATTAVGTVIQQFASTAASDDWAESEWSTLRGFPASVAFHQDRIWFSSTKTSPQTEWGSQVGNYYSFDVHDVLLDTDAISIRLTSNDLNNINNIISLNNIILALTTSSEWQSGSSTGAITPTTISASPQSNIGSSIITPILVENKIVYLQPSNAIIRFLNYSQEAGGYIGDELNVLSSHLFEGYTIVDMAYQREPNSTAYLVRSDGKLLTMIYMPSQEIIGFSWHDTDGLFENVSVLNTNNKDEVWTVVYRNSKRFIEIFEEKSTEVEDQWYLDSAVIYDDVATTTISGLDHLEGKTVQVLGDGNVIKSFEQTALVVTNGEITLPFEVEKAIIGLQYISDLETLPIDMSLQNGTLRDKNYKISEATLGFQNSRGGWIGDPDIGTLTSTTHTNTLDEIINLQSNYDTAIALFSGSFFETIRSDFGKEKRLFIRQYDPLPMNILYIIPRIEIGG